MQTVDELTPVNLDIIAYAAKRFYGDSCYLHWTAGHYGQVYSDYHISIDYDGKIYFPFDNDNLNLHRSHTYLRNSGAVGIALLGCWDAEANNGYDLDMGSEPITQAQIEACAAVVAVLCKNAPYLKMENVLTHEEIATIDGYGPGSGDSETRWDLWYLPDSAHNYELRPGGQVIRGKAIWYQQQQIG